MSRTKVRIRRAQLNDRITIKKPSQTRDEYGGISDPTPSILGSDLPASVQELSGTEYPWAGQFSERLTHRVWIENLDGLTTACEIEFGTRLLRIQSAVARGDRLTMILANEVR